MEIYFDLGIDFNSNRTILLSTVSDWRKPKKRRIKMDTTKLVYGVLNTRTGSIIAAFLLSTDAQKYIDTLHAREGVHGAQYEIVQ